MTNASLSAVSLDENARRRFEAAWGQARPSPIEEFLPPEDDARFLATLEELVHIEIEFAWKAWDESRRSAQMPRTAPAFPPPLRVEDYLSRFPFLDRPAVIVRLLEQEALVRQHYGCGPSQAEYHQRFPEIRVAELPGQLCLAAEPPRDTSPALAETFAAAGAESATAVDGDAVLPRQLGNNVLLEEIGRGGMGIVFRARQTTADRIVALKVVRLDFLHMFDSEMQNTAIERFRHEVQAAARLDHENIVAVYEVGKVGQQPYFSMRYIDGPSLSQILRDGPISSRQAATYMEPVARAVEHAHQLGILHRDLKPQNILVDDQSDRPYVADFGLAKMLRANEELTQSGEVMGSPPYMSPEQALDSAHVTARSDVYGLGATLYHILTGRPPFQAATVVETIRQVADDEPVPPCRLNPAVDKDLETICVKCLEKEPARRYATAQILADDLARYLQNEPILARPIGPLGRFRRWCLRNPLVAMLLASIATLLIVGAIGAVIGVIRISAARQKTEIGYRHARETVNRFFTRVSEETLLNEHGLQPLRHELLEEALGYYNQFLDDRGDDPELKDELAATHFRIGRISEQIESPAAALAAYRRALAMQEHLLAQAPDDQHRLKSLGDTWNAIGGVSFKQRQFDDAQAAHQSAQRLRSQLVALTPGKCESRRALANSLMNLGLVRQEKGDLQQAGQYFNRAQALRAEAIALDPASIKTRRDLGIGHYNLAVLHLPVDNLDLAKAATEFEQAIDRFDEVLQEEPHDLQNRHRLAVTYRLLADVRCQLGQSDQAGGLYALALDQMRVLSQRNPDVPDYQSTLAQLHMNLGLLQSEQGDTATACASLSRAFETLTDLIRRHPNRHGYRRDLAVVHRAMAVIEDADGHPKEAWQHIERAKAHLLQLVEEFPDNTEYAALLLDTSELLESIDE